MDTNAPAIRLDFVRTVEGMAAGSDMRWSVTVADIAEAITTLGYYRNEDSTITMSAWNVTDTVVWRGSGRAGHHSVVHNLDVDAGV